MSVCHRREILRTGGDIRRAGANMYILHCIVIVYQMIRRLECHLVTVDSWSKPWSGEGVKRLRGYIFTDDIKIPFRFNGWDSLNIMMVVKENIYPTLPSNKTSWCHLSVLQDQSMFKCTRLRFCVVFKLNTNIRALTLKLFHVAVLMSYSRYISLVYRKNVNDGSFR